MQIEAYAKTAFLE